MKTQMMMLSMNSNLIVQDCDNQAYKVDTWKTRITLGYREIKFEIKKREERKN